MNFISQIQAPQNISGKALWLCFKDNKLLVREAARKVSLPYLENIEHWGIKPVRFQYLGQLGENHCFSGELPDNFLPGAGGKLLSLRELYFAVDEYLFSLARRAFLIVEWDKNHQYCGKCGAATKDMPLERAKLCPVCGLVSYPRIAPAVIVAVIRVSTILLAHAKRFTRKMYSVLAGFVEPGESLEECLEREVYEEVGLKIKNIKYFNSQSWPFPNSLMVAFTARYASGEIRVDGKEIEHAAWFRADELPLLPPALSIARSLIDWFARKYGT